MAKAKKQKVPGQYAGMVADEKFYYLSSGLLVKADGSPVEPGQAKRYAPLLEPFVPPAPEQPKEVLEEAFPDTYEEPRKKKRKARKDSSVELREAAEKEAADLKRDVQDLKQEIGAIAALMREDAALIRQQLTVQQRSITLLTEIAKNITGGGGGVNLPSISGGFGWKGMLASMLGGAALGAAGGYFLNDYLSEDKDTEAAELVPEQPQEAPQQSAGIQEAQQRGEQKTDILTINARELSFNSDKLKFEVNELTIDADDIKTEGRPGAGGGGGGGGGPSGGGPAGGAAAPVQTQQGTVNPAALTPSFGGVEGGKSAFQGFAGSSPTPESVKGDLTKAQTLQPASNFVGSFASGSGAFSTNAAGSSRASPQEKAARTSFIRSEAQRLGIDPDIAVRVANSEGNDWAFARNEQGEASYGAFQLNTKGRGVGYSFEQDTGKKANDPANERLTITYALEHVRRNGWGAWQGAKKQGITGFQGVSQEARISSKTPIKIDTEPLKPTNAKQTEIPAMTGMFGSTVAAPTLQPVQAPSAAPGTIVTNEPMRTVSGRGGEIVEKPGEREAYQNAQAIQSPMEKMVAKMEEAKVSAKALEPPIEQTPQQPASAPPQQDTGFSGAAPSVSGDKQEEIPGMKEKPPGGYFDYLFRHIKPTNYIGFGGQ